MASPGTTSPRLPVVIVELTPPTGNTTSNQVTTRGHVAGWSRAGRNMKCQGSGHQVNTEGITPDRAQHPEGLAQNHALNLAQHMKVPGYTCCPAPFLELRRKTLLVMAQALPAPDRPWPAPSRPSIGSVSSDTHRRPWTAAGLARSYARLCTTLTHPAWPPPRPAQREVRHRRDSTKPGIARCARSLARRTVSQARRSTRRRALNHSTRARFRHRHSSSRLPKLGPPHLQPRQCQRKP